MEEVARFVFHHDTLYVFTFPHTVRSIVKQDENELYHVFNQKIFQDGTSSAVEHSQKDMSAEEYNNWLINALHNASYKHASANEKRWLDGEDVSPETPKTELAIPEKFPGEEYFESLPQSLRDSIKPEELRGDTTTPAADEPDVSQFEMTGRIENVKVIDNFVLYYLRLDNGPEQLVDRDTYIRAESAAGFNSRYGNKPATGSFSNGVVSGRVCYNRK